MELACESSEWLCTGGIRLIGTYINSLIGKAINEGLTDQRNCVYIRNKILAALNIKDFATQNTLMIDDSIPQLLGKIIEFAVQNDTIRDTLDEKEILKSNIMDLFLDMPSTIEEKFYKKYEVSPQAATDYFYQLSQLVNYIQTEQIKKNVHYKTHTSYGEVDITINLSKPEKSPEQIKRELEAKQKQTNYPTCVLCVENEGYEGRIGYPARANHRIIKVDLNGEPWYLQYSPYIYYDEHSILFSEEHRDMKITKKTFERLLAFVNQFPHYFIGSNADLPIVGGSILSHDHYQAGNYTFAMEKADSLFSFSISKDKEIEASVLKWPLSVIRLRSKNMKHIIEASNLIYETWKQYSDKTANIISHSGDERHNTVTPIARKNGDYFEMDIVLRNNRTTDDYPDGIFHPHQDVQHIKKENVGLIEIMGLAVLPARLKDELEVIKKYIVGQTKEVSDYHQAWAEELKGKYIVGQSVDKLVEDELGSKFIQILENAGVYKQNDEGITNLKKFIKLLRNGL